MDAQIDHVVMLLPYRDIENPPEWLTNHFTLSPGGRHADGITENRLILFSDGTYLELIAFINDDPEKRRGHWWNRPCGVVDYSLTTPNADAFDHTAINARLSRTSTDISYEAPRQGGRRTPAGVDVQWKVTFPKGVQRGAVPFWCHDITPRDRRIPLSAANTTHPCGALGMRGVLVEAVGADDTQRLRSATAAALGIDGKGDGKGTAEFDIGAPNAVPGSKAPVVRVQTADAGEEGSLVALSLILQGRQEVPAIRRKVGDGFVSILFEDLS